MGKPKKRTSPRRTGMRRSHLVLKLARAVNAKSPVKAYTTRRESAKPLRQAQAVRGSEEPSGSRRAKPKAVVKTEK